MRIAHPYVPDQGGEVDDKHLVVCLDVDGFDKRREINIGEKVKYVLELIDDLMVNRQLLIHHFLEIILDVLETRNQTLSKEKR